MGNMSYCKFENTLVDMVDCNETLVGMLEGSEQLEDLNESEQEAIKKMHYIANEMMIAFKELEIDSEEC